MMTPDQVEWIRQHGITKCPPGPVIPMEWHDHRSPQATERDRLLSMTRAGAPLVILGGGNQAVDLKQRDYRLTRKKQKW